MRNYVQFLSISLGLLLVAGCPMKDEEYYRVVQPESIPASKKLTLSQEDLLCLDYSGETYLNAQVTAKRILGDNGVEFDIYFPSNAAAHCWIEYVSGGDGGNAVLAGAGVGGYEKFALQFTLVAINGQSGPDVPYNLTVGALVGPTPTGGLEDWRPVTLDFASQPSAVSQTPMWTRQIRKIGFRAEMTDPSNWPTEPSVVTLLVSPVPNAGTPVRIEVIKQP
jgi:hypothetical protein